MRQIYMHRNVVCLKQSLVEMTTSISRASKFQRQNDVYPQIILIKQISLNKYIKKKY